MSAAFVFAVVALLALVTSPAAVIQASLTPSCPSGQFFDNRTSECRTCSSCPPDLIIKIECEPNRDTQCHPFVMGDETRRVHLEDLEDVEDPAPDVGGEESWKGQHGAEDDKFRSHHHQHHHNRRKPASDGRQQGAPRVPNVFSDLLNRDQDKRLLDSETPARRSDAHDVPSVQDPEEAESQWKVLALALIVVLCVVCVFLIVFLFVVCYLRSSRSHLKQVLYSADQSPHRTYPTTRPSAPSLRYVQVPTHAQGSGRGGSSGGSGLHGATPPCGKRPAGEATYRPEGGQSGQTMSSTTKSSDYVYFKTPLGSYDVCDV